jgi:hypothetical protein
MALQPRFSQGLSEKILPLYSIIIQDFFSHGLHGPYYNGLHWFRVPSGMALNSAFCGRSSTPLIMCPAKRNLLLITTPMTFELLNFLSSSILFLILFTPSTIFGSYIVRRTFRSKTSNRFTSFFVSNYASLPYSRTGWRWPQMFLQAAKAPIYSLDSSLYIVLRCHKNLQVHKFVDDFKTSVANSDSLSSVENRPICSCNHIFCILFVDLRNGTA